MAGVATDSVDRNSRGCIVEDEWEVGLKSRRGVAIPRWCLGINETLERPAPSYRRVLFVVDKVELSPAQVP